jgi:very-short-patch-repair endonuclease
MSCALPDRVACTGASDQEPDHGQRVRPERPDVIIARIAAEQHGIASRAQLVAAGVTRYLVDARVRAGLFRPLHAGVYQVGPVAGPRAREIAALLACRKGVLSHWTAAILTLPLQSQYAGEGVDVTIADAARRGRRPGIRAHRGRLAPEEVTRVDGLPVTTPLRTLLDLARVATARELEQTLAAAERAGLLDRNRLAARLERHGRQPGTLRLRRLLGGDTSLVFTRSEAEERLLGLVRAGGLPDPEVNVSVHGWELDFYWRRSRLAVEVDGYAWHGSARAFLRDRQRDAALAAAGIQVVRLGWHQIVHERDRTLVQLAQALARAR